MKILLWAAAAIVVVVLVMAAYGSTLPDRNENLSEKIQTACKRQFPGDAQAQAECGVRLIERELDRRDQDRMRAAAQESGIR